MPGGAPGDRRGSVPPITRCRLACFSAAWRFCRSCLETASCTGIGGRCDVADESDGVAHGPASVRCHRRVWVGLIHDSAPAEESPLGIRLAEFLALGARGIARARLSRRHPATETAKA